MLRVFIGFDPRQPVSYNVLQQSIVRHASQPVSITPLIIEQLPIRRVGLTPFTFSRFLVPFLCNYQGWGLFLDADMLLKADINELFQYAKDTYAVMVVKNVLRFEWASMILFNCARCTTLTPNYIETNNGLHTMDWCDPQLVGDLPSEWNHLVGYDAPRPDAKLIHYSQGIPGFPECHGCEYTAEWVHEHQICNGLGKWVDLMGNSVHAVQIGDKIMPKLKAPADTV